MKKIRLTYQADTYELIYADDYLVLVPYIFLEVNELEKSCQLFLDRLGIRIDSQIGDPARGTSVQQNTSQDLFCNWKKRNTSMVVAWSFVSFSLVYVHNGSVFKFLWKRFFFLVKFKKISEFSDKQSATSFEYLCRYSVRAWCFSYWQLFYGSGDLFYRWKGKFFVYCDLG